MQCKSVKIQIFRSPAASAKFIGETSKLLEPTDERLCYHLDLSIVEFRWELTELRSVEHALHAITWNDRFQSWEAQMHTTFANEF